VRFAFLDGQGRVVLNGENLKVFRVLQKESESLQDELRVFDLPMRWTISSDVESLTGEVNRQISSLTVEES
jgi:hypothetical protein